MKYTDFTVPVTLERTGLLLRLTAGKYATTTLDLQDHFGWSDAQAQQVLSLLDRPDPTHEQPANTTINLDQLVDGGWVRHVEDEGETA